MANVHHFAFLLALATVIACSPKQQPTRESSEAFTIKVDGSSTVFPIAEAAAEDYQASQGGRVRVTVGESGSGGGFKKFCRGETHLTNSSRPITAKEMADCKAAGVDYIELPVAFDALSVVVHPSNPLTQISIEELKKAWQPSATGTVTNWTQIKKSNPDLKLGLYGPGAASGTFEYFTEAVNGKSKDSRTDYTASEDDNVLVQGVANDRGGLGYFGYAYYVKNKDKLKALAVVNKQGKAVLPSKETVEDASYNPLSRPIFTYVSVAAAQNPNVTAFVNFWLQNGAKYAEEVGYVGLPRAAYDAGLARVKAREAGTAFGGANDIGASITEVLSRKLVTEAPGAEPAK